MNMAPEVKKPPDRHENGKGTQERERRQGPKKATVTLEIPRWLFLGVSSFVCFMAIIVGSYYTYDHVTRNTPTQEENSGEVQRLFSSHDLNTDGYLSLFEFESLYHRLLNANVSDCFKHFIFYLLLMILLDIQDITTCRFK